MQTKCLLEVAEVVVELEVTLEVLASEVKGAEVAIQIMDVTGSATGANFLIFKGRTHVPGGGEGSLSFHLEQHLESRSRSR